MMKTPLLLIGHGTRSQTGAAQFERLVEVLREQLDDRLVEGCFLELRPPTIAEAWNRLVQAGVSEVAAVPLLLFSAGHAKRDIPDALAECAANTPEIPFYFGRPLSRQEHLLERAGKGICEALPADADPSSTALVVVGRGSFDPCAQTDTRLLAECLFRALNQHPARLRFTSVDTAFYAMAEPKLPDVLTGVCRREHVQQVVVHPHLLFAGQLLDTIAAQVAEVQRLFPNKKLSLGPALGPDPLIAKAVIARMLELEAARTHA